VTTPEPPARSRRRPSVSPRVVLIAAVAVLAVVFVFQNTATGRVHLLLWTVEMPAWIWLLTVFLSGVAAGSVFPWLRRRRTT
jgi:uncharacterized integral membrane protein